ncbi:hypothetical protein NEOLI_002137 [Neolecta irregularis DAH-3]|uniref:Uncharacterized protein n=1 Tax=Neolecta irregularis (strain DAH-3) TaxID=1198029 RepID=A0A1U7LGT7_NEOID|nr:hypothetical protein NEOLI_002137 [Neolecta irregularis DAH-3]|eukprot:OLL21762.1 hypothetical protein NEOLI_002137 [Neolecta irregularis DAH-3]
MGWRPKKRADSLAGMSSSVSGTLGRRETAFVAPRNHRNFSVFRRRKKNTETSIILEIKGPSVKNSPGPTLIEIGRIPQTNVEYRPLINSLQPPPRRFKPRETPTSTPSRSVRNEEPHGELQIRVKYLERELLRMKGKLDGKKTSKYRIITKEDLLKQCARVGQSAQLLNDLRVNAAALAIQRIYRGYVTRVLIKRYLEINAAALTIQKHWRRYALNHSPSPQKAHVPQAGFVTLIKIEREEREVQLRVLREELEKLKDEIRSNFGQTIDLSNKDFDGLSPRTDTNIDGRN